MRIGIGKRGEIDKTLFKFLTKVSGFEGCEKSKLYYKRTKIKKCALEGLI